MMVQSKQLQSETGYIDARPLTPDRRKLLATHGRTIHWVNRVILTLRRRLPISPEKQTFSECLGMSQTCHERTLLELKKRLRDLALPLMLSPKLAVVRSGIDAIGAGELAGALGV